MEGPAGGWVQSLFGANGAGDKNTVGFVAAAFAIIMLGSLFKARRAQNAHNKSRGRSVSFSSDQMLSGVFPHKAEACQPVVNAIFYFKKCPDAEKMIRNTELLMWYDRMRVGVVLVNGHPKLMDLKNLPARAREIVTTTKVTGEEELQQAINKICSEDLPFAENLALWRMHRIENSDGRSCVLGRAHHVIGDGMAMVALMNKLFSDTDGKPLGIDHAEKKKPIGGKGLRFGLNTAWTFLRSALEVALLPNSPHDTNVAFFDKHNPSLKMTRRVSTEFPTVKLDFVKALKNKSGVTVNDVLMAATSGMIRRYSRAKGDRSMEEKVQLRALMPIAFPRTAEDMRTPDKSLRNLWALVSAPLAVNETTPVARLKASAKTTAALKKSPNALIQLFLQDHVVSRLPNFMQRQIAMDVFSRHSMVFSNVPGPDKKMHYCGEPIESMMVTFPNMIPQVILISYNGGVFFNLSADPDLVDTKLLAELYLEELRDLAKELGVDHRDVAMLYKMD